MKTNIIKINNEKLDETKLNGNFLYEENGELYFTDTFHHVIFELDKDYKICDETQNHSMDFEDYIQKFMRICSRVKNKPSLLFLNYVPKSLHKALNGTGKDYKDNYNILNDLKEDENIKQFNDSPCVTCEHVEFVRVLRELIQTRSNMIPKNNVFVFLNEPECLPSTMVPSLETIITISRSRNIYFILNVVNKEKYIQECGPESYQTMKDTCRIKFICNNNGVVDIQPE